MTVYGEDRLVYAIDMLHEVADLLAELTRQTVAGRVRNVDHRGAGFDDGLHNACQILVVGASGILAVELHVLHVAFGVLRGGNSALDELFAVRSELILNVVVARADARVDTFATGILEGLRRHVDVFLDAAGEGANHGPGDGFRDFDDRLEVAWAGDGESGFENVYAERLEGFGDFDLFDRIELATGHLLAVAQGGVEDVEFVIHLSCVAKNEKRKGEKEACGEA